jgi:hypothetical protein
MINSFKFIAQEISEVADAFLNSDLHEEANENPGHFN